MASGVYSRADLHDLPPRHRLLVEDPHVVVGPVVAGCRGMVTGFGSPESFEVDPPPGQPFSPRRCCSPRYELRRSSVAGPSRELCVFDGPGRDASPVVVL